MWLVSIRWEVWQCELFQLGVEGGVEQTLVGWLAEGSSERQTKVGGGRGVAVVAWRSEGQRRVAVKGEP